jgi:hypothetical protein
VHSLTQECICAGLQPDSFSSIAANRHHPRVTKRITAMSYTAVSTPNVSRSSACGVATAALVCFCLLFQVGSALAASDASAKQIFLKGPQYFGVGPMNKNWRFLQGGAVVNESPEAPKMLLVGYGGGDLEIFRAVLCFDFQDQVNELKAAKKIELVFHVVWVNNSSGNSTRQLEISRVKTDAGTLSSDEIVSDLADYLQTLDIPPVGYEIGTYSLDLTDTIHQLLEKGEKRIVLRFRDIAVEESGGVQDQSDAVVLGTTGDKQPFIQFSN